MSQIIHFDYFAEACASMKKSVTHSVNSLYGIGIFVLGLAIACFDGYEKIGVMAIMIGLTWAIMFFGIARWYDYAVGLAIDCGGLKTTKDEVLQLVLKNGGV